MTTHESTDNIFDLGDFGKISPLHFLAMMNGFNVYQRQSNITMHDRPFCREPKDWKELQNTVGKIFSHIGYHTEIEKSISLGVRGTVEIDVFCSRTKWDGNEKILIECKNWSKKVSQSVVHSVRSLATDTGANKAYIISKNGFQSGAIKNTTDTVIKTMAFNDLINLVQDEWFKKFTDDYYSRAKELKKYNNYLEMLNWRNDSGKGFINDYWKNTYEEIANSYFFILLHIGYLVQLRRIELEDNPEPIQEIANFTISDFLNSMPLFISDENGTHTLSDALDMRYWLLDQDLIGEFASLLKAFDEQYRNFIREQNP